MRSEAMHVGLGGLDPRLVTELELHLADGRLALCEASEADQLFGRENTTVCPLPRV